MKCKACSVMVKDWEGSDPRCSFPNGQFSSEGWMCATNELIRDLVYEGEELPSGVDYQYCDDMKYATVNVFWIEAMEGAMALWIAWYKNRGSTDAMYILYSDLPPRLATEQDILIIHSEYKALEARALRNAVTPSPETE